MKKADLAITSAGRTVLELASLGIPMLVATQNEREQHHAFALTSPGTVFLGAAEQLTRDAFTDAIGEVTSSWILRKKMSQSCLNADIGNGIHRILAIIDRALQKNVREDKRP
jgi:spore coat polysaccharide biosynthesis predicted glycosyltransferase SpsG